MKIVEVVELEPEPETEYKKSLTDGELLQESLSPTYNWYFKTFPDEPAVYRGSRGQADSYLVYPAVVGRKSANTTNEYTLLMSNHPTWKKFPRRDSSIICTTNKKMASGYGRAYAVILPKPFKLGVCPAEDLWESFDLSSLGFSYLDRLSSVINRYITKNLGQKVTYQKLVDAINSYKIGDAYPAAEPNALQYIYNTAEETSQSPVDVIMDILSPTNFTLATKPSDLKNLNFTNREVWTSNTCLMIPIEKYTEVSSKVLNSEKTK